MKRETLKELGLTDEQIEKVMAENGKDIQSEKSKADKYKDDASKVAELQAQIDELTSQNMSDIDKANKAKQVAEDKVAELEKSIARMELKGKLADKGITGESADKLLESLNGGAFDVEVLAEIISARESEAAKAKELEIAKGTINPGGNKTGNNGAEKTEQEKIAEQIAGNLKGNASTNSIVESYL